MKLSCLSPPLPQIKPELLAEIAQALTADGCRLLIIAKPLAQRAQIFSYGLQPRNSTPIEKHLLWQDILKPQTTTTAETSLTEVYLIDRIWEHPTLAPLSISFAAAGIQSLLIVPLRHNQQCIGCLTLFRSRSNLQWTDEELKSARRLALNLYFAVVQQQVEQMFQDRAYRDLLTGLPHRVLLDRWLNFTLTKMSATGQFLAVILINLDRFKNINDSLGHRCGDRLLQLIATRLKHTLGASVIVGRWSGDEFALLIPELRDIDAVKTVADRVLGSFDLPFVFEQDFQALKTNSLYIKIGMGIAIATDDNLDQETLLQQADIALRRAKNNGKNSYEIYDPIAADAVTIGTSSPQLNRLRLENMLDRAIVDRKLFLHYQPQIDIQTGTIVGIEALLRCQDHHSNTINPADFIPIAEETGSIIQLGEWVLRTACNQSKLWQEMGLGDFPVAVNFSVKQLQDRNLIDTIAEILTETKISPATLEVEITESIAIKDLDLTISILESLREIGVKISLDDFGTGYSSLAALKYLPLDRLKIDRSFIRELKLNTIDASIVSTIVNLGHELKLNVVAEGVETIEQFELLRSINCDAVQGFFFSRPLAAADLETMIITGSYWHHNCTHPHNLLSH
ncbi:MAG: GGDEF domain-containing protein [Chamaesiphon sp.]|nr:GGDEF domain-containing protein [Chamaesiphon sp.]